MAQSVSIQFYSLGRDLQAKISDDARQIKQLRTKSEAHRALSVAELAKYKGKVRLSGNDDVTER